jgi:methylated-DNA-protein-cysteine methyltransferase related protein
VLKKGITPKVVKRAGASKNKKTDFFDRVYKAVARIPHGKVTTYGAIAECCGVKSAARTVGWALNSAAASTLPCHRVLNRNGALTGKFHFGDSHLMEDLLKSEGIKFNKDGCVDLNEYFWHPSVKINNTLLKKKKHRC